MLKPGLYEQVINNALASKLGIVPIFFRNTGFTTAYVGSSNLSNAALTSGAPEPEPPELTQAGGCKIIPFKRVG